MFIFSCYCEVKQAIVVVKHNFFVLVVSQQIRLHSPSYINFFAFTYDVDNVRSRNISCMNLYITQVKLLGFTKVADFCTCTTEL